MTISPRSRGAALIRAPHSYAVRHIVLPMHRFLQTEISSAVVLLVFTAVALIWANSRWNASYEHLWQTTASLRIGQFYVAHDLRDWINDAAMVVFFFVVGLEIKREFQHGHLSSFKAGALPVAAALGGMVVPASIYYALNASTDAAKGWGVPMATDIAFALGVLALGGDRVPTAARIFLLALATVDDIGAIIVIAVVYSKHFAIVPLLAAAFLIAVIIGMRRFGVDNLLYYVPIGILFWFAVFESGVHATMAGVILGLLTPTRPVFSSTEFSEQADESFRDFKGAQDRNDREAAEGALGRLYELTSGTESPADRLIRLLHPWSSFVVLPLFALANAGIMLTGSAAHAAFVSHVSMGVLGGLVLGKAIGIGGFSWAAIRVGFALPLEGVTAMQMAGIAALGGIGFTVSLFISDLAFADSVLTQEAKIGVLVGSVLSGAVGYALLRRR